MAVELGLKRSESNQYEDVRSSQEWTKRAPIKASF